MNEPLNFWSITIGEGFPVVTIAEAAVEHLGNLNVAMRMAEKAKDIGANFIKYQMHLPDDEMIPDVIKFWKIMKNLLNIIKGLLIIIQTALIFPRQNFRLPWSIGNRSIIRNLSNFLLI